jgi:hypothetical protein
MIEIVRDAPLARASQTAEEAVRAGLDASDARTPASRFDKRTDVGPITLEMRAAPAAW